MGSRMSFFIDCNKYNLTENIRSCFVENWWRTDDVWIAIGAAIAIVVVVFWLCSEEEEGYP